MKLLIATDIHLGHKIDDEILGLDPFKAFSEVLEIAHLNNVDFVLLGGDLFDTKVPTQETLHHAFSILNRSIFEPP